MRLPIRVIKRPLAQRKRPEPPRFNRLGELYLFLLENKDKIKDDLADKDEAPPPKIRPDPIIPSNDYSNSNEPPKDVMADKLASFLGTHDPLIQNTDKYVPTTSHPTLADIERQGNSLGLTSKVENVKATTVEQQEEKMMKQELLHKFAILRRSYKGSPELQSVPEFNEFSDYDEMKLAYDGAIRRLALDGAVDNYKTYLIMGFYLIEFGGCKVLKMPFEGFANEQLLGMNKYEKLLVELGEKSYLEPDSKWPVELRLLGVLVLNAGVFLMTRMAMGALPSQLSGMMNTARNPHSVADPPQKRRRKRMRGPSLNIDEIPDDKRKID